MRLAITMRLAPAPDAYMDAMPRPFSRGGGCLVKLATGFEPSDCFGTLTWLPMPETKGAWIWLQLLERMDKNLSLASDGVLTDTEADIARFLAVRQNLHSNQGWGAMQKYKSEPKDHKRDQDKCADAMYHPLHRIFQTM